MIVLSLINLLAEAVETVKSTLNGHRVAGVLVAVAAVLLACYAPPGASSYTFATGAFALLWLVVAAVLISGELTCELMSPVREQTKPACTRIAIGLWADIAMNLRAASVWVAISAIEMSASVFGCLVYSRWCAILLVTNFVLLLLCLVVMLGDISRRVTQLYWVGYGDGMDAVHNGVTQDSHCPPAATQ